MTADVDLDGLDPVARGRAYRRMLDEQGLTHRQLAERVGVSQPTVSSYVRLLTLDPQVQRHVAAGRLSMYAALQGAREPRRRGRPARRIAGNDDPPPQPRRTHDLVALPLVAWRTARAAAVSAGMDPVEWICGAIAQRARYEIKHRRPRR